MRSAGERRAGGIGGEGPGKCSGTVIALYVLFLVAQGPIMCSVPQLPLQPFLSSSRCMSVPMAGVPAACVPIKVDKAAVSQYIACMLLT